MLSFRTTEPKRTGYPGAHLGVKLKRTSDECLSTGRRKQDSRIDSETKALWPEWASPLPPVVKFKAEFPGFCSYGMRRKVLCACLEDESSKHFPVRS